MKTPFLVGERLYLRSLEESDLGEEYLSWLNDSEVTRYLGIGRTPETLGTLQQYLKRFDGSPSNVILAIVEKKADRHIGNVSLNRIHWIHRTADTSILIGNKAFWGKDYAFEAWHLLLDHAFKRLGLHKIIAGAVATHTGSLKVLKRLGFQEEGLLRGEYFLDGEYQDVVRLGLLEGEFYKHGSFKQGPPRSCR